MNARETIFHFVRHYLRQYRYWLLGLVLLSFVPVLAGQLVLERGIGETLLGMGRLAQIFAYGLLIAQVFLADSTVDSTAAWWTRPISASQLLLAKALYVVIGIWVPLLLLQILEWSLGGFTPAQMGRASLEFGLYTVALALFIAGIASASSQFWSFVAMGAGSLLGLMVCMWQGSLLGWRGYLMGELEWMTSPSAAYLCIFSAVGVAGLFCLAGAFVARSRRWVLGGILVFVSLPLWAPGMKAYHVTHDIKKGASGFQVVSRGEASDDEPVLLENLAIRGARSDQFITPLSAAFAFKDSDGREASFRMQAKEEPFFRNINLTDAASDAILSHLPPGTRLNGQRTGGFDITYPPVVSQPRPVNAGEPGHLGGEIAFMLHEVRYHGVMPLRKGAEARHRGHVLQLIGFDRMNSDMTVRFLGQRPRLLWGSDFEDRHLGGRQGYSTWMLVALHPQKQTGQVAQININWANGPFPVRARGYDHINLQGGGRNVLDADLPELHVFRLSYKATSSERFDFDGHRVETDLQKDRHSNRIWGEMVSAGGIESLEGVTTVAELRAKPLAGSHSQRRKLAEACAPVFAADLEASLEGVPWPELQHEVLLEVLRENLTEDHWPALRAAWKRDERMSFVVEARKWSHAFSDEIKAALAERRAETEPYIVRMGAELADAEHLVADLSWHGVHSRRVHRGRFIEALSELSGVDAESIRQAAWKRERSAATNRDLLEMGLRQGLPGAIDEAVAWLRNEGQVQRAKDSMLLPSLLELTPYEGPWEGFYAWIEDQGDRLAFDAEVGRYVLTAEASSS